jgi:hypothetical protein
MTVDDRDGWQDDPSAWLGVGVAVITVTIVLIAIVLL